jgi:hypothetical protein
LKWTTGRPWEKTACLSFQLLLILFFTPGLFLAMFLPYHAWDGLAYGEWSRLIAQTGDFHFPTITDQTYHRPLFYVVQGWIWRLLGYHEAYGRGLGLAFTALLFLAVWRLSQKICPDPSGLAPYVGASILVAIPGVAAGICNGMTDVPVAAMVGCAGAVLWTGADGELMAPLVALVSGLAVLVKPSALVGLIGLALAGLLGRRVGLGRRITAGCVPLLAGAAVALIYDAVEAHRLHMTLTSFLTAGTTGYYEKLSAAARLRALWDWTWLGPGLRFPLTLSLLYAALRIVGVSNRAALGVATVVAIVPAGAGLWTSWTGSPEPGLIGSARAAVNVVFLICSIALATCCLIASRADGSGDRDDGSASRLDLARLMVWIAPGLLSWFWYAAYDERLMSVVWAPMAVLACSTIAPVVVDGLQRRRWPGIASASIVLLLAASDLARIDGLGATWAAVGRTATRGQFQGHDFRRAVVPDLVDVVDTLAKRLSPSDALISPEGRLRFFFPGHVAQGYPRGCQDLRGYDYFVLTRGASMEALFASEAGVSATIAYWSNCRSPSLNLVSETSAYAIFRIEKKAL